MNWPPMLLYLRIPSKNSYFGLWLPWLLIYPILLALLLIALPFVLVLAILMLTIGNSRPLILAGPCLWRLLFSLRGLKVDIQEGKRKLMFAFV